MVINEDNTFVVSGKIYQIDKDNGDGTFTSHLIGFEDKELQAIYNETSENPLPSELSCRFCGKVCKSAIGLNAHERACADNPDNRKGEIDGGTN